MRNKEKSKEISSLRFRLATEFARKGLTKEPAVDGIEHIEEIPKGSKAIIAASHLTDADMPLVARKLSQYFKLLAIDYQANRENFFEAIGSKIAGEENFLSVTSKQRKESHIKDASFEPEDFRDLNKKIDEGYVPIWAAHRPTFDGKISKRGASGIPYAVSKIRNHILDKEDELDDNPLGNNERIFVLPIAVDIKTEDGTLRTDQPIETAKRLFSGKRPDAKISIGKPLEFKEWVDVEEFDQALIRWKSKNYESNSQEESDKKTIREGIRIFRNQSLQIINAVSDMLPVEKRAE